MAMRGVGVAMAVGVFAAVWGASAPAHAIEVMCSSADGECTVSNDDGDVSSCLCEAGGSEEGSGLDEWAGLSEAELLEICEELLSFCSVNGPGTTDPTGEDTGGPGTSVGSTTAEDTGGPGGDVESGGPGEDTGVSTIGTDTSDTGEGTAGPGGDVESGGEETAGTTGGDEQEGTAGGSASAESTGPGDASTTTPDGEESSGGDATGDDSDKGGCGCTAGGGAPSRLVALASLGLLGLRTRRRARAR